MNESVKHHFVPQYLLRNFSSDPGNKFIYCFDKATGRAFQNALLNTGSEKYFNTIKHEEGDFNFEYFFDQVDAQAAPIIVKIIAAQSLAGLSGQERGILIATVAYQMARAKMARTSIIDLQRQIKESFERMGWSAKNVFVPDEEQIKAINLHQLLDLSEVIKSLGEKFLQFQYLKEDVLMLSDNPVVLHNSLPYGEMGLNSRGIEVYFPISPKHVLSFACKSRFEELRVKYSARHFDQHIEAYSLYPMELKEENANFLNRLQLINSNRFVYKRDSDFSLAEDILKDNPHLKEIQSKLVLGEMGKGPPPIPDMPAGYALVIYGVRGNHLLEVSHVTNDVDIYFQTSDIAKVEAVQNDLPMKRAMLYNNGRLNRQMADSTFKKIEYSPAGYIITLSHADEAVSAIINHMKSRRKNR